MKKKYQTPYTVIIGVKLQGMITSSDFDSQQALPRDNFIVGSRRCDDEFDDDIKLFLQ